MNKVKKQKHNYTSELELKSLLIRINNSKKDITDTHLNTRINKYILWHTKINAKKYEKPRRRNNVKAKLKEKIISYSELTAIDEASYERFGQIILLMIKNILKKPQFSGYTYKDDFYSDAIHKILKYLHNFDHKMISKITGTPVNSFAYISQIIHNSILYILKIKKKENDYLKNQIGMEMLDHNLNIKNQNNVAESRFYSDELSEINSKEIVLSNIQTSLYEELQKIKETTDLENINDLKIYYPSNYLITFDEYNKLKPIISGTISILQIRDEEDANAK